MTGAKHKGKEKTGFTLVEMVVAVGLFSIVTVVVAQLFITTNRAQQRGANSQKVQSDARIMMAQIADRLRSSAIDYAYYGGPVSNPTDQLAMIDENGESIVIQKSDSVFANTVCPSAQSTPCLEISEDGGITFFAMSSEHFTVDAVRFYLDPTTDPLLGPDVQPRVTFVLGITPSSGDINSRVTTYLQTSVSSRVYVK
jgi:prepilin-type N-terminal cleavage/methylation domain-containing protein